MSVSVNNPGLTLRLQAWTKSEGIDKPVHDLSLTQMRTAAKALSVPLTDVVQVREALIDQATAQIAAAGDNATVMREGARGAALGFGGGSAATSPLFARGMTIETPPATPAVWESIDGDGPPADFAAGRAKLADAAPTLLDYATRGLSDTMGDNVWNRKSGKFEYSKTIETELGDELNALAARIQSGDGLSGVDLDTALPKTMEFVRREHADKHSRWNRSTGKTEYSKSFEDVFGAEMAALNLL